MIPKNAVLLLVDVQKGHDDPKYGRRNNPHAEERIAELLAAWRASHRPVIHVQHASRWQTSPFHPTHPGHAFKESAVPRPGETVIVKNESSAFIGTPLESMLRKQGIDTVVVVGMTTPHCVATTARMAGNLGFKTYIVADATAANDGTVDWSWSEDRAKDVDPELVHAISLATMHSEFATVVHSRDLLSAL